MKLPYAFDLLTPEQAEKYRTRWRGASAAERHEIVAEVEALAMVGLDAPAADPPTGLRDELLRAASPGGGAPVASVRAGEGEFRPAGAPGVAYKPLYRDPATGLMTMLVKMEPGAEYPSHRHGADEQCLVLEGDVRWRRLVYRAGDFVVTGAGSVHPTLRSEQGALLLIVAGENEFV